MLMTIKIEPINPYEVKFNGEEQNAVWGLLNFVNGRTSIIVSDYPFPYSKPLYLHPMSDKTFARFSRTPNPTEDEPRWIAVCRKALYKYIGMYRHNIPSENPEVMYYRFGRKSRSKKWVYA